MKSFSCFAFLAAAMMCSSVSCGSRPVSTDSVTAEADVHNTMTNDEIISAVTGNWETVSELVDGKDIMTDIKSYTFHDNGNGGYFDPEGVPHQIGWSIGEGGTIQIFYVETEQLSGKYTLTGDEMVITEQDGDKVCETHLKKVAEFSNKNIKES